MLFQLIPFGALASTFTRQDGEVMTGDTGAGFSIVDSFHAPLGNPSYSVSTHVDTRYGGGGGTGYFSPDGVFAGGATAIADGTSPASYGTVPPYEGYSNGIY